jgi:hypothetical protein
MRSWKLDAPALFFAADFLAAALLAAVFFTAGTMSSW